MDEKILTDDQLYKLCNRMMYRLEDTDLHPDADLSRTETFAVMMAYSLHQTMISAMADMFYQPAQDYLAELWDDELKMVVSKNEVGKRVSAEKYIDQVMKGVTAVRSHIDEGHKRDMPDEVIFLHDELNGFFMDSFDDEILDFAMRLYIAGNELLCQPHTADSYLEAFMKKFKEIRQELIDQGVISETFIPMDGLAVGYVYEHAKMKADGGFK